MADKAKKVLVRFIRTHYPAATEKVPHPVAYTIGQEVELEADHAHSLSTYDIVQVLTPAEPESHVPARLGQKEALARIEQLMPGADKKEPDAIAELERIRDAELAHGAKPRDKVLAALKSAGVKDLPAKSNE